jgi:hypothetical protein
MQCDAIKGQEELSFKTRSRSRDKFNGGLPSRLGILQHLSHIRLITGPQCQIPPPCQVLMGFRV